MNLFDLVRSYLPWLRYYRTGRPPARRIHPDDVISERERMFFERGRASGYLQGKAEAGQPPAPLRPCPFCGRSAETNGIAVWCPTLTHGLMTREQWQNRI